jgi:nitrate/nitrite transporter NarK
MRLNIAKTPQTVACLSAATSVSDYQPCQPVDRKSILIMTVLGSSLAFMDGSVVNVALPKFQTTFYATSSEVQWVVQSYALFCAALLLLGGTLGDRLGRKRIFAVGIGLFTLASAGAALSMSLPKLVGQHVYHWILLMRHFVAGRQVNRKLPQTVRSDLAMPKALGTDFTLNDRSLVEG